MFLVFVGGVVVEFYIGGVYMMGDFDFVGFVMDDVVNMFWD